MTPQEEALELRKLVENALPDKTAPYGETPALGEVFLPKSHVSALHPDTMVVVGDRGAGKSFWWSALQEGDHRALVETLRPETKIGRSVICVAGFGVRPQPGHYPGEDELLRLQQDDDHPIEDVWKTIIVFAVLSEVAQIVVDEDKAPELRAWHLSGAARERDWSARIRWVSENPGLVDRLLHECDQELQREGRYLVVLFDALDRCASDWTSLYSTVRGLLQTTLKFRARQRIRAKVFLRTDQFNEQRLAGFPDASKLLATRMELRWSSAELYSLLFQLLANHPVGGLLFRGVAEEVTTVPRKEGRRILQEQLAPWTGILPSSSFWPVPPVLQHDAHLQAELLHALTGPAMGPNRRKGLPYRWIINHLWDAHERITPRPFLLALRAAATQTSDRHGAHVFALHYQGIKAGIKAASELRVTEIKEDYDWLALAMGPLRSLAVPCNFMEIESCWEEAGTILKLEEGRQQGIHRLSPAHLSDGAAGVVKDLEQLGILYRMRDGRENMPDIYRLWFGLKRKGGIKSVGSRR